MTKSFVGAWPRSSALPTKQEGRSPIAQPHALHAQTPIPSGINDERSRVLRDQIDRQAAIDLTPLLIYRLDNADDDLLVNLAWQFHIQGAEGWDATHTTDQRRTLIRNAIEQHRYRGTPWAVKTALAASGFKADILEHHTLDAAWHEAGGDYLDGLTPIDGRSTLSAPGGEFAILTHHWAEYALDMEVGDAVLTRNSQTNIRAIANATAPARSHLAALRYRVAGSWGAPIRVGVPKTHTVMSWRDCKGSHVPHFDTLCYPDGPLGGTDCLDTLDGYGGLDGHGDLGPIPDGEPLDGGFGGMTCRLISRANASLGGDMTEADTLSGLRFDRHTNHYVTDTLDGLSNLGLVLGHDGIWANLTIREYPLP